MSGQYWASVGQHDPVSGYYQVFGCTDIFLVDVPHVLAGGFPCYTSPSLHSTIAGILDPYDLVIITSWLELLTNTIFS